MTLGGCLRVLLGLLLALVTAPSPATTERPDEASLHAAYILNFIRYSHWPGSEGSTEPYVIVTLAPLESVAALRQLTRRIGAIQGRPVLIRPLLLNTMAPEGDEAVALIREDIARAHVVYVASTHRAWNGAVIAAAAGRPILTVGVGSGFVQRGGMFGLVEDGGRVVFNANHEAIRLSQVNVSARVMVLARPARPGRT